jgi:two-component system KDP operon response regulator KdpE
VSDVGPVVLLVEDEPHMRRFLRVSLAAHGYRLVEATTAREALQLASSHNPELVLLDLGLPDGDGIDVTRALRGWMRAPVVVISARGREDDKVAALDAGADDYLTKPFGVNELLARLRVALRHARAVASGAAVGPVVEVGGLIIDVERREVRQDGVEIHLTPLQWRLLAVLAQHAGMVVTHRQILRDVWGPAATETHVVRVHMAELRKKLEADPARPKVLLTEPGVGYRLRA